MVRASLLLSLIMLSCARPPAPALAPGAPPSARAGLTVVTWRSSLGREHPLVGKVWDVRRRAFLDAGDISTVLQATTHLLLGEKHDNSDHHQLQANLVKLFAQAHPGSQTAFEMFDLSQQRSIDAYRKTSGATAAGLARVTAWEQSGWPAFSIYAPVLEAAIESGGPIVAANLPISQVRAAAHGGASALDASIREKLARFNSLPVALEQQLYNELRVSHCGHLPEAMLPNMAVAQHARDVQMASRVAEGGAPTVLIAGAGHVRNDRGVPYYLRQIGGSAALSVAFLEVESAVTTPVAYAGRFGTEDLPFDWVWFTPRVDDDDPCATFHGRGGAPRPAP